MYRAPCLVLGGTSDAIVKGLKQRDNKIAALKARLAAVGKEASTLRRVARDRIVQTRRGRDARWLGVHCPGDVEAEAPGNLAKCQLACKAGGDGKNAL